MSLAFENFNANGQAVYLGEYYNDPNDPNHLYVNSSPIFNITVNSTLFDPGSYPYCSSTPL